MSYYFNKSRKSIVYINSVYVEMGKAEGLTELTDEQIEKHLSDDYVFDGSDFTEIDTSQTDEEISALRDVAYSNTITGSDKYFIEAYRKDVSGDDEGAAIAQAAGEARIAEIKAEYPFND